MFKAYLILYFVLDISKEKDTCLVHIITDMCMFIFKTHWKARFPVLIRSLERTTYNSMIILFKYLQGISCHICLIFMLFIIVCNMKNVQPGQRYYDWWSIWSCAVGIDTRNWIGFYLTNSADVHIHVLKNSLLRPLYNVIHMLVLLKSVFEIKVILC
jgi:hypothetical protein